MPGVKLQLAPSVCAVCNTPGILRGLKLVRCRLDRASMRHALDNPEPSAPRQARAAGRHAKSRMHARIGMMRALNMAGPAPAPTAADWLMPRLSSHDAAQL